MGRKSAVQWLIDNLEKYEDYAKISFRCLGEIEIALEMEKQQIIDAFDEGKSDGYKTAREWDEMVIFSNSEQYYTSTYGSKGSDEQIINNAHNKITRRKGKEYAPTANEIQDVILDEEIESLAKEYILYNDSKRQWVIEGMKLYREHLKQKI